MLEYIILFTIYSVIGWLGEILFIYFKTKKIVNRGFLIGPYCPIYGFGGIIITLFLSKYHNDIFVLFTTGMILCAILEYFVSWVMEKIFKLRWWDYTQNKFNINGRICLETMIPFGIGGVIVIQFLNPFLINILNNLSTITIAILAIICSSIMLNDLIVSCNIIFNLKDITKEIKKDSTEEIKKLVSKKIKYNNYLYKRLINAFPSLKKIVEDNKKRRIRYRKKIKNKLKNLSLRKS